MVMHGGNSSYGVCSQPTGDASPLESLPAEPRPLGPYQHDYVSTPAAGEIPGFVGIFQALLATYIIFGHQSPSLHARAP